MPPTMINTQRSTGNINQVRRPIDIDKTIEIVNPSVIPFVILLNRLRRRASIDPKVRWLEDEYVPQVSSPAGVVAIGALSFDVAAGEGGFFAGGDLVMNTVTNEIFLVGAVATDTLSGLTRGYGSTVAVAMAAGQELLIIGPAIEEGAAAPRMRSTVTVEKFNFRQTFRTSYQLTDELGEQTQLLTDQDKAYQRNKALREHMIRIERALFFGERAETSPTGDSPRRSMGGVRFFVTSNVDSVGATLTLPEWNSFLEKVFLRGSGEKWFFAAPAIHTQLAALNEGNIRVNPDTQKFGLKVVDWVSPHGIVHMVLHRLFAESTLFKNYGFLLDMERVTWVSAVNTFRRENIQLPSELLDREELVTKGSFILKNELAHGILRLV